MDKQTGQGFIREKLNDLGQRRSDLEHGLAEVQQELDSLDREAVDADLVRATLGQIKGVFETLKPYEQRELMQLVLRRAEVNEREITLDIYALTDCSLKEKIGDNGSMVRMRQGWLPVPVSHRTLQFSFKSHLPSLLQLRNRETNHRIKQGTSNVVAQWRRLLDDGIVKNRAELARREGLSRARITKALQHT
jgi:hypothetical protein